MTEHRRPRGLKTRGRRFWGAVTGEYDLSAAEAELLAECCRLLDEIDALAAIVDADGPTAPGSKGQVREHPALGGLRASRMTFRALVASLGLDDEDGASVPTALHLRGKAAARARWRPAGVTPMTGRGRGAPA